MFRRSLLINLAFSLVSTLAMMAAMPTPSGLLTSARSTFSAYAQNSALLSPVVHRIIKPY
jgi:hypothetical protein